MNFGRVLTAMVTPFDANGGVDFDKTTNLIEYLIQNGSEGLVVGGTTGESPTLTSDEKIALFRHTISKVNRRIPVIAGTGSNNTHASIILTKKAEESGADAIMLVTPYYNKPSQEGLYQHFSAIASETKLPVMLYNIPGRSVVKMNADTIIRLSKIDNIIAIKEASGDLDLTAGVIEHTSDNFSVYSGEDSNTLPMLSVGADGVVSVASHVAGQEIKEMVDAFHSGNTAKAAAIHRKLLPVMNGLFAQPSPSPVKTALNLKGVDVGGVRLPLIPLTESEQDVLKNLIDN
ncbi:4-hydroxy-tetrahydrodipicolinate synthase [Lentibacillus amyloliquefaciens]|uniref:4-hydroxy-tetrahydrodipicolinate synthase n=1 Tax=Lentibacillus amyloliquefaciens TaxID=1472767 RepID=A0A0U4FP22_9BACI|nr:4-hydroxy-tetrahydrodipicolinate synthase [Lentibacillus amyloliquefaciens]ALX47589.1 4-hydroxy-tetrahydrodipicolinate synthase [Lentibacillus amyloliquefaciens]